jgi:5-amino-6-(5-phosphoribosylamino)uracil reductase
MSTSAVAMMQIRLSAACSIDGYMDDTTQRRLVLSSEEDLLDIQRERAWSDAILVGAGTVRADNPRLSVREPALIEERIRNGLSPQPVKVTLTSSGDLDPEAHFFQADGQESIVLCPAPIASTLRPRYAGLATVIGIQGPISARAIAQTLQRQGIRNLFVEGGGKVLSMFLSERVYDHFRLAVAPFFVGDAGAPRLRLLSHLAGHRHDRLIVKQVRLLGDTTVIDYQLARGVRWQKVPERPGRVRANAS